MSLTSAGITSTPSSRCNRAERCPVPEPRSSIGPWAGSHRPTSSINRPARRSMTASNSDFSISRFQQLRRCAGFVPALQQLLDETEDLRPEATLEISGMDREARDATIIQRFEQPADLVTDLAEPGPATAVPGPGRERHLSSVERFERE